MAGVPLQTVVRHLRRVAVSNGHSGPTDAQLLQRFVADHDQGAFELLLWRYGAMVLGLCRRILRHEQEAEDAFQATFLTLARKGGSVRGGAVAGWLHTVAYRVALAAKARADRRASREVSLKDRYHRTDEATAEWRELQPILDEEIARLPDRYRVPFVLCYLEGLTVDEAAGRLGRPRGTIGVRLARARERLRISPVGPRCRARRRRVDRRPGERRVRGTMRSARIVYVASRRRPRGRDFRPGARSERRSDPNHVPESTEINRRGRRGRHRARDGRRRRRHVGRR